LVEKVKRGLLANHSRGILTNHSTAKSKQNANYFRRSIKNCSIVKSNETIFALVKSVCEDGGLSSHEGKVSARKGIVAA